MAVDPTGADIKQFAQADDGREVVMLNLLRFKPAGRASYERYASEITPFLKAVNAEVIYLGDCGAPVVASAEPWDAVLLVRYPSRQAFLDMVFNSEYQKITHLRTEALEQAVLQPTTPWGS